MPSDEEVEAAAKVLFVVCYSYDAKWDGLNSSLRDKARVILEAAERVRDAEWRLHHEPPEFRL